MVLLLSLENVAFSALGTRLRGVRANDVLSLKILFVLIQSVLYLFKRFRNNLVQNWTSFYHLVKVENKGRLQGVYELGCFVVLVFSLEVLFYLIEALKMACVGLESARILASSCQDSRILKGLLNLLDQVCTLLHDVAIDRQATSPK